MRRIAPFVLLMALGGCSYHTWSNLPFTTGNSPNAPVGDSETMLRVEGRPVAVQPLTPQAGNVWPGPLPPTPTLETLEKSANFPSLPEQPVPGSPMSRGAVPAAPTVAAPTPPPRAARGSSTPPGSNQPGLAPPVVVPPASPPSAAAAPPPAREPAGQTVQTPSGPGVMSGGTSGYQTMTMPNGGSAIVIPNGNGTSTVIRSDGTIETIPTPKSK